MASTQNNKSSTSPKSKGSKARLDGSAVGETSKHPGGRPESYTLELAAEICGLIAEGKSLRTIAATPGMPSATTIFRWLADEGKPEFREQYARAKAAQADMMAEDILNIADDGSNDTYIDENGNQRTDHDVVARSRLRVEARKWLASKFAPKRYGEKVEATLVGDPESPLQVLHRQISGTGFKPREE